MILSNTDYGQVELGGVTPVGGSSHKIRFPYQLLTSPGSASRGTALNIAAMPGGSIKSEPGFSPAIDAQWAGPGADYIHNDPSGAQMRLNAHAAVK